jgi:hypothetical protein
VSPTKKRNATKRSKEVMPTDDEVAKRWLKVNQMIRQVASFVPNEHMVNSDDPRELTPFLVGIRVGMQECASQLTEGAFDQGFELFMKQMGKDHEMPTPKNRKGLH